MGNLSVLLGLAVLVQLAQKQLYRRLDLVPDHQSFAVSQVFDVSICGADNGSLLVPLGLPNGGAVKVRQHGRRSLLQLALDVQVIIVMVHQQMRLGLFQCYEVHFTLTPFDVSAEDALSRRSLPSRPFLTARRHPLPPRPGAPSGPSTCAIHKLPPWVTASPFSYFSSPRYGPRSSTVARRRDFSITVSPACIFSVRVRPSSASSMSNESSGRASRPSFGTGMRSAAFSNVSRAWRSQLSVRSEKRRSNVAATSSTVGAAGSCFSS